jgi:hypothetical protein
MSVGFVRSLGRQKIMTHDELLATIDVNALVHPKPLVEVVKLHAPVTEDFTNSPWNDEPDHVDFVDFCKSCVDTEYPCKTIQVIEATIKELDLR